MTCAGICRNSGSCAKRKVVYQKKAYEERDDRFLPDAVPALHDNDNVGVDTFIATLQKMISVLKP